MTERVLVVDDDDFSRQLLGRVLRASGYEVILHGTAFGTTALIREEKPDVVVIDVDLPGLRGSQLVKISSRRVRANPEQAGPLFILYSGMDEPELFALAETVGATALCRRR